ncbi:MAG: hypothetical protein HY796_07350 [Elusimicrobia bacterium]|nr:hypothetical protein [Elusimicrobiota bacterium]
MKKEGNRKIAVKVSLKKYNLNTARYAAYAVSDAAYVFIAPSGKGAVAVEFTLKNGSQVTGHDKSHVTRHTSQAGNYMTAAGNLVRRFREELKDEKIRAAVFDANRDLREFMILKALSYDTAAPPAEQEDSGLTPEQEKELDALIAQVESEIKKESAGSGTKDPLGITRTWEEKYGAKTGRKRN